MDCPSFRPPWYKHGCFDTSQEPNSSNDLVSTYQIPDIENTDISALVISIAKSTYVDFLKTHTDVTLETGKSEMIELKVKNNAGFLLGKLCLYNKQSKTIWPIEESRYIFELYKPPTPSNELIHCPTCNVPLNPKNLKKHMKRQHWIS